MGHVFISYVHDPDHRHLGMQIVKRSLIKFKLILLLKNHLESWVM